MDKKAEKTRLRRLFLDKRDLLSYEFIKIASKQIHENLQKINSFKKAEKIGAYYSMCSEVLTKDILQEILKSGRQLSIPKVVGDDLVFKRISSFADLEKGNFPVLEPKKNCPDATEMDAILVPAIAMTRDGQRLGYGYGYYDRYLAHRRSKTIALTYSGQIVKTIPATQQDVKIDYVVTEDEIFSTSKIA